MPRYTYQCTDASCGAQIDLNSSVDERNKPKTHKHKRPDGKDCTNETLVRGELEMTAFTPYGWKP